ncbi:MAG TPA: FecR domain-containing protein [Chryseosolibacter sp.]
MEKSNFDRLLERYLAGEVSEEERIKLEKWLDSIKVEDTTNLNLSPAQEEKIFQRIISKQEPGDFGQTNEARPRKNQRFWIVRIAAALLLLITAGYLTWMFTNTPTQVEKLILTDGSIVWLEPGSKLSYSERNQDGVTVRFATLTGDALFEVFKDKNRPFIVQTGPAEVRVSGTSFKVRGSSASAEVSVLTGRVVFTSTRTNQSIPLLAKEKGTCTAQGRLTKRSLSDKEKEIISNNAEYELHFDATAMSEVAERLEAKFDKKFRFIDATPLSCRVTVDLTDHSLHESVDMLQQILDVSFQVEGDTITVSGVGCGSD